MSTNINNSNTKNIRARVGDEDDLNPPPQKK